MNLEALEERKLVTSVAYDQFYAMYNSEHLTTLSDEEFANWKAAAVRLWTDAIDAARAYTLAMDQMQS